MKNHWGKILLVGFAIGAGYWYTQVRTEEPAGIPDIFECEGLNVYRDQVVSINWSLVNQMTELNPDALNPNYTLDWTKNEWVEIAAIDTDIAEHFEGVSPPEWAVDWHQAQIEYWTLGAEASMAIALGHPTDGIQAKAEQNRSDMILFGTVAERSCSDFPYFVSSLGTIDGWQDGEPVTPMFRDPKVRSMLQSYGQ